MKVLNHGGIDAHVIPRDKVAKLHALNDMVRLNLPVKLLNAFNDRRKELAARK